MGTDLTVGTSCTNFPLAPSGTRFSTRSGGALSSHSGCTPDPTENIPEPTWGTKAVACGGATLGEGCNSGEICAPQIGAAFQQQCVFAAGDVACNGAYSEKILRYAGVDDQRSCSVRSCDPPTSCGGNVSFLSGTGQCDAVISAGSIPVGGCGVLANDSAYAIYNPQAPCTPVGGELNGEATETGPVTFCCLP
jgi:hypothetical protein